MSGRLVAVLATAFALLLGGCAQAPVVVKFAPLQGTVEGQVPVWPKVPEVPRYSYAGELTGEWLNPPVVEDAAGTAQRILKFIVGLVENTPDPLVLQRPQGGTVDARGRIFVTDVSKQAVFVFDENSGEMQVWRDAFSVQTFIAPIAVVVKPDDTVLVSDAELGYVVHLAADGRPLGALGKGLLERPTGMAADYQNGLVYVADTRASDIKVFDFDGELVRTLGGRGDSPGEFNSPTYIAFRHDRLYVTDTLNSRIQVFDRNGRLLQLFGERGLYIGNLARPKGVAVDDEGNIYIVESYYDHLLVYDSRGRFLMPLGGTGRAPGQFYLPAGVWVDDANRVYVADMFNGRVSIFQFLGGTP